MISFGMFKEVLSERNISVISVTTCLYQAFMRLWFMWWSLYLLELGTPIEIVGVMAMIQDVSRLAFQFPGGMMADRFGRKRIIILGASLRLLTPIFLLLGNTWQELIPGIILNSASNIYMPALNAIIAESLPSKRRGAAFGAYRTLTSIPQIVMPVLSGIYMDYMGIAKGVRTALFLFLIAATIVLFARILLLKETLEIKKTKTRSEMDRRDRTNRFPLILSGIPKTIVAMLIVSCVSNFSSSMAFPFLSIYGINQIGLTKTQWGLLETIVGIVSAPVYFLGGIISDRFGRIPCILIARSVLPLSQAGLLLLKDFNLLLFLYLILGIGAGFGGGGLRGGGFMGGPAWQALIVDIVQPKDRGKAMGLIGMTTGLASMPAPTLGGYLWEMHHPDTLLIASSTIGFLVIPTILIFVNQPSSDKP
jgi:MFS family permease